MVESCAAVGSNAGGAGVSLNLETLGGSGAATSHPDLLFFLFGAADLSSVSSPPAFFCSPAPSEGPGPAFSGAAGGSRAGASSVKPRLFLVEAGWAAC